MPGATRGDGASRPVTHQSKIDGALVRHPPQVVLPARGAGGPGRPARTAARVACRPSRTRRAAIARPPVLRPASRPRPHRGAAHRPDRLGGDPRTRDRELPETRTKEAANAPAVT